MSSFFKNFSYWGRIQNFLDFKSLPFSYLEENFSNLHSSYSEISSEDSIKLLRDIEYNTPFPIGFIGPIESIFQWSTMVLTSYSDLHQDILDSVFEEIIAKVEDEYFVMGPTFSVADCVLMSDLKEIEKTFVLPDLIKQYTLRVENFLK